MTDRTPLAVERLFNRVRQFYTSAIFARGSANFLTQPAEIVNSADIYLQTFSRQKNDL